MPQKTIWIGIFSLAMSCVHSAPNPSSEAFQSDTKLTLLLCSEAAVAAGRSAFQSHAPRFGIDAKIRQTRRLLDAPAPTIMNKPSASPESGDKHDYYSISYYGWPESTKPDGMPWIQRDGKVYPGREKISDDPDSLGKMSRGVRDLGFSYAITQEPAFAQAAARWLHTFFVDPATRMNPHLNFAQALPGRFPGWFYGIIDGVELTTFFDAVAFIQPSGKQPASDLDGLRQWMASYRNWLKESPFGKEEAATKNNHGNWYGAQLAAIEFFLGNRAAVADAVRSSEGRILQQIGADGGQPAELKRTRPLHYSVFNLNAILVLATLGAKSGVNWFKEDSQVGGAVKRALAYIEPCVRQDSSHCPFPRETSKGDVEPFRPTDALLLFTRANLVVPGGPYRGTIEDIKGQVDLHSGINANILCADESPH